MWKKYYDVTMKFLKDIIKEHSNSRVSNMLKSYLSSDLERQLLQVTQKQLQKIIISDNVYGDLEKCKVNSKILNIIFINLKVKQIPK